jgi:hypothetical protein
MRTPGELTAYFQALVHAHAMLNSFFEGNYDDILAAERSTMQYPLLWLESPEVTIPDDEDGFNLQFNSAFVILFNSPTDDLIRTKTQMEIAFRISLDVLFRLLEDSGSDVFDFTIKNITMDPVSTLNNDNDHGWRVQFSIFATPEGCGNNNVWSESYPFTEFARFELTDHDSTQMTFETESIDDGEQLYVISWYVMHVIAGEITTETYGEESEIAVPLGKNWQQSYVELKLDYGDYQKYASMYILAQPIVGTKSVPFQYNPIIY